MHFTLRRRLAVFGLLLVSPGAVLRAQTASVMGTITRSDNTPARRVLVSMAGKSSITDVGGRYRIDEVPAGRQRMQITQGKKVLLTVEVEVTPPVSRIDQKLP